MLFQMDCSRPKYNHSVEEKSSEVNKRAVSLAQSTISLTLTERQAKNKKSEVVKATREMSQQLGVGLAIHQDFVAKRSSKCSMEVDSLLNTTGSSE